MRIAVFGAGGLGGYFGARLAQAGADVHFIARGPHLAALREHGVAVHSVFGDFHVDVPATDDPARIGPVDVVLFTVKSYDTEEAAAQLPPLIRRAGQGPYPTAVASFQNGVDNIDRIAGAVGREHVVGGASYVFSRVAEPGVIEHTGGPTNLIFGELDGGRTERVAELLALCRKAGIRAEIAVDIRVALWSKYAFLCAASGMTATVRLPVGEIRTDPAARGMFRALVEEGWQLARAEGVPLADDFVERQLALLGDLEPGGFSSLHNDLVTGHRMELEALHGELLRRAGRAGLDVPATRAVYAILSPWARRNWPPSGPRPEPGLAGGGGARAGRGG